MCWQQKLRRFAEMMLAALVLAIPACGGISSENPLSDPDQAKADEKLIGTWEIPSADSQIKSLTVDKLILPGYPPGVMKLTLNFRDPSSQPLIRVFFITELNGQKFVNCCGGEFKDPRQFPAWDKLKVNGFAISKYEVKGEALTLWSYRRTVLEKAIESGKLKGKWAGGPYYSYTPPG